MSMPGAKSVSGLLCVAALCTNALATTQSEDSYYVNRGTNRTHDPQLGEFQADLGGHIPFSEYDRADHLWVGGLGCGPLRQLMLDHVTDLDALNDALEACSGGVGLFPAHLRVPDDPAEAEADQAVWWAPEDDDYVHVWKFWVNGGPILVIKRNEVQPDPTHVLLFHTGKHDSDFGTNNDTPPLNDFDLSDAFTAPEFIWAWDDTGRPNLKPTEQAVERGDIVVLVKENQSADLWHSILRTQDADHFIRNEFAELWLTEPISFGSTYVDGASWGAQMAGSLGLLQSGKYAASLQAFTHDVLHHLPGVGDFDRLNGHRRGGLGLLPPARVHSDRILKDFYLLVDNLGIRFDAPDTGFGMQPWDVHSFSIGRRLNDVQVPIFSVNGAEDDVINWHWQQDDPLDQPLLQPRYHKNLEHGGVYAIEPGVNEFFHFTGTEWADALAATSVGSATDNPPLVPVEQVSRSRDEEHPYHHTLTREPCRYSCPEFSQLLAEFNVDKRTRRVKSLGQGVWPANHDHLGVQDLDGDGNLEVFFGNLDGFFHVLELRPDGASWMLVDEYKSRALGWGCWALSADDDGRRIWLADQRGRVHRLRTRDIDRYGMRNDPIAGPEVPGLYEGAIDFLHRGNFVPGNSGQELLVLGEQHDWVLMDLSGAPLGLLPRGSECTGPGYATVANIDEDDEHELIVPALDGHVWVIEWDEQVGALTRRELVSFTGLGLYRAEVAKLEAGPASHLLLFGRDDNRAPGEENVVVLVRLDGEPQWIEEYTLGIDLDRSSFAWIGEPGQGQGVFAIGGRSRVERISVTSGGNLQCETFQLLPSFDIEQDQQVGSDITAIAAGDVNGQTLVFVSIGSGRIYILDDQLEFTRYAGDEWADDPDAPSGATEEPWYANRTLAHCFAADLVQEPLSAGRNRAISLHVAEFTQKMFKENGKDRFRVAELEVRVRRGVWNSLAEYSAPRVADRQQLVRNHIYEDLDGDGQREAYFMAETGTVYEEGGQLREFANRAIDVDIFPRALGGRIFERFGDQDYSVLGGLVVPKEAALFQNGSTEDWWYAKVGSQRIPGQLASEAQSVLPQYDGTSMTHALLPDPTDQDGEPVMHVVTGTLGGNVYAVRPGTKNPLAKVTPSTLNYVSPDLGWRVVGMDAGDLNGDGVDELVVGTWLDTGTSQEWQSGDVDRNRGHVHILQANPGAGPSGRFDVIADLSFDDVAGDREGIGSGVFGIKIDDVNGDGTPEIWAGDSGRLYLFRQKDGAWEGVYASRDLGAYPGVYNNLFPIKEEDGRTSKLMVVASGYIYGFGINLDHFPND